MQPSGNKRIMMAGAINQQIANLGDTIHPVVRKTLKAAALYCLDRKADANIICPSVEDQLEYGILPAEGYNLTNVAGLPSDDRNTSNSDVASNTGGTTNTTNPGNNEA